MITLLQLAPSSLSNPHRLCLIQKTNAVWGGGGTYEDGVALFFLLFFYEGMKTGIV